MSIPPILQSKPKVVGREDADNFAKKESPTKTALQPGVLVAYHEGMPTDRVKRYPDGFLSVEQSLASKRVKSLLSRLPRY
jgi:hypothetical protein